MHPISLFKEAVHFNIQLFKCDPAYRNHVRIAAIATGCIALIASNGLRAAARLTGRVSLFALSLIPFLYIVGCSFVSLWAAAIDIQSQPKPERSSSTDHSLAHLFFISTSALFAVLGFVMLKAGKEMGDKSLLFGSLIPMSLSISLSIAGISLLVRERLNNA